MKKTMLLGAVTLGLVLGAPTVSLGTPNKTKIKKKKRVKKTRKAKRVKNLRAGKVTAIKAKKKIPRRHFGPIDVTAGPEGPQAAYILPRARVKYTRPSHEKELLTWIMRSMGKR